MPSLAEYRTKIKGIRSTQQITQTLKMIAGVRLAKAQKHVSDTVHFADGLQTLLFDLISSGVALSGAGAEENQQRFAPFLKNGSSGKIGVFVIAADKGLCGGFNNNTCRKAVDYMKARPQSSFSVYCAGRKASEFFRRIGKPPETEYPSVTLLNAQERSAAIARELTESYERDNLSELVIIYNELKSAIRQIVVVRELFPLKLPENYCRTPGEWIMEPDAPSILSELIPRYVESRVYQALVESYASESAARMNAMDNASKNAQDLIDNFTLVMNKLRQAQITRELTEIVGTSEALK
jgi:F-type H+-transporting ATPase subunit gamma